MDDKLEMMRGMVERLNQASDAYYNGKGEQMTDFEWDALFDQLKKLEEETGTILPDSPTNNVSADTIAGAKEEHEFAALSLAKTKKVEDLVKWADGRKIWMSWKLDGLTLVATYDQGKLTKLVTRGDGHIGTNITHLASAIDGVQAKIADQGHVVIRGEALISYADFESFNMESEEEYANPRNLASGSLTLKDIDELKRRKLTWIPFTLVHTDQLITSWGEQMDYLTKQGFHTVEHYPLEHPDQQSIKEMIDRFSLKVTTGENPYPVDGLVIAYDDVLYAATGSVTGHHATRAGYAYKWQDEAAESQLDHIEWSCAVSSITPVAVFQPVELEGTVVKRASLCNISECERLNIGGKGTTLSVIKANKIIPKIIQVGQKVGELEIPNRCPACGAETYIDTSDVSATRVLRCSNPKCSAKQLKKFTRFVSKAGMDIDGISEMTLARFISQGWISNYGDIMRLEKHQYDISQLDGFGEKSAQNIVDSLEKARNCSDTKLLFALNIPLVGQDVAKKLLGRYPLKELVELAESTQDLEIFSSIDGIGPEKSTAFVQWFQEEENKAAFDDLLTLIQINATELAPTGNRCDNMTFVVTGDVYSFKNRNELKAYIESQGGKVTGSVTKKTNYLINNDITSTSGKNQKAHELNIPIISEDEFIEQFGKNEE